MTPSIAPEVLANIVGPDLLVILGLVVLLFGASQIPKLARSLGEAQREFKKGQNENDETKPDELPRSGPEA